MYTSCLAKQEDMKTRFADCETKEQCYQRIIDMGKRLPPLATEYKTEAYRVQGCQSQLFLHTSTDGGAVLFEGESDALISRGLAALLIFVYSGESPETILKCPPTFLEELGIPGNLSPNRANGLYSLHLRMKQEALKLLIKEN